VVETLEAAGYDPEVQAFDYLAYEPVGPSTLQQVAPNSITYVEGVDFGAITQTDPGDVTANVTPVDLQLGLGNTSTSGCQASDFAGFPAGNIALLQRGDCTFELRAENAAAAGAVGIVIFNQGNTAANDRNNIPAVTLTANNTSGIPVLGTTYALGVTLANTPGLRMRVFANTLRQILPTYNVIAELPGSNDHNVVMAGAPRLGTRGPGHQRQRLGQRRHPRDRAADGEAEARQHRALRMVGRRGERVRRLRELRQRPDSDQSGFVAPVPVPPGSIAIEDLFESFHTLRNEPYDDAEFSGRSDYQAFINNGIPAGGLFTGAEVPKTADQAAIWGGTGGPSTTRATTRRATRSRTTACTRSRSTPTRSRSRCSRTRTRPRS
jgi:Zn-dependent M28 family amino/carboxypeptidase